MQLTGTYTRHGNSAIHNVNQECVKALSLQDGIYVSAKVHGTNKYFY